jgi:hypothetical protein
MFNMLIVPGFAAPAGSSLYSIIAKGLFDFKHFIREFFDVKNDGDLFITLILQSGALGFMSTINAFSDLYYNYFSTFVTSQYRMLLSDLEPWRKEEWEVFMYGYYFAQHVTIIAITLYFS